MTVSGCTPAVQVRETSPWRIEKTEAFLGQAFAGAKGARMTWCPCGKCANTQKRTKEVMGQHLCKFGFTQGYTRWTYHGEGDRTREEVVRPRVEGFDDDGGVADMLDDFGHGKFDGGVTEEDPEPTAKAYYDMLDSAQKPLHGHTSVSQLDAIGRVMDFKSRCSMSRQHFDDLLAIIGTLLTARGRRRVPLGGSPASAKEEWGPGVSDGKREGRAAARARWGGNGAGPTQEGKRSA
jgi:hypothetical protein